MARMSTFVKKMTHVEVLPHVFFFFSLQAWDVTTAEFAWREQGLAESVI